MFCSKCGTQNPDDASFCFKCGSKLISNTSTEIKPIEKPISFSSDDDNKRDTERLVKVAYISYGKCPNCKQKVTNESFCPKCKSPLEFPLKKKSVGIAALLSLIVPGLGGMYAGSWIEGIVFFFVGIVIGLYDVTNGSFIFSLVFRLISAGRAGVNADNVNMPEKYIKMRIDGDGNPIVGSG